VANRTFLTDRLPATDVRLFGDAPERQGRVARRLGRPAGRTVPLVELAETARAGVLAEFAAAIREAREPETSGRDNLLTLELVFAAVEAAASGRAVRL
jgi:predicted dehydrogenase